MPAHPMLRSRKQKEIEEEYGEPFLDVLKGFAQMGYGCDTTARILEYDTKSFRALLKRRKWKINWPALKDQIIQQQRSPLSQETREKIRQKALTRYGKKERLSL